ncbi:MAG: hypothetical protein ACRDRL_20565 [Sciscionella sp.]
MTETEPVDGSIERRWAPICGAEEFAAVVRDLVAFEAPRLFAIVQELGDRVDGRVAAWGMAFDDGVAVVSAEGHATITAASPERAARFYARRPTAGRPEVTSRVVWAPAA